MAIIWQKRLADTDYRVVRAGHSIRLYRNNVLHTQWNPRNPIKGQLWELFLLTSVNPNSEIKRVLVLGAGGGAVINLINYFFPLAQIDAVDLDKMHIQIAKRFFKVNTKRCKLFHADAFAWVKQCKNGLYDLIIDDVFHENDQVPYRSISASANWVKSLLAMLSKKGVLAMNFADNEEWKNCNAQLQDQGFIRHYQIGIATNSRCENKIVHITQRPLSAALVKNGLQSSKALPYLKCWADKQFSYRRVSK